MDLFGRDSDTTSDDEDYVDTESSAPDVRPESPPPPPGSGLAVGRALFARAVSDGDGFTNGGETKGEGAHPPSVPPQRSVVAQPVKTLPRPAYDGDTDFDENSLVRLCGPLGSTKARHARCRRATRCTSTRR